MKATLRIAVAAFLMSGLVFAAGPSGSQTTRTLAVVRARSAGS
jgi:hypothetical protein